LFIGGFGRSGIVSAEDQKPCSDPVGCRIDQRIGEHIDSDLLDDDHCSLAHRGDSQGLGECRLLFEADLHGQPHLGHAIQERSARIPVHACHQSDSILPQRLSQGLFACPFGHGAPLGT